MENAGAYVTGATQDAPADWFDLAPDVIAIVGFDGVVRRVNRTAVAISGYAREEIVGVHLEQFFHWEDLPFIGGLLRAMASGSTGLVVELRCVLKSGELRWLEWNATPAGPDSFIAIGRDVGARRTAEQTLSETSKAMGDLGQGLWVRDMVTDAVFWSPSMCKLFGVEMDEISDAALSYRRFVHPADCKPLEHATAQAYLDPDCHQFKTEYRIIRPDGGERTLRVSMRISRDADGRPVQTVGTALDVTELRRVERNLKHSQELTSAFFDSTAALVVVLDRSGNVVRFNRAAEQLTGYSRQEIEGQPFWEWLIPSSEQGDVRGVVARLFAGQFPSYYTNHWITRDGRLVPTTWSNNALLTDRGEVEFVISTGIDISSQVALREQLSALREAYRRLVELGFEMVIVHTPEGEILEINAAGAALLGAPPEKVVGRNLADIHTPEQLAAVREGWRLTLEQGELRPRAEVTLIALDGRRADVEVVATIAVERDGRPAVLAVMRDITEHRLAQSVLRAREHHFKTLAKVAPVGIFQIDARGQCTYVNERYMEISGYDDQETLGQGWWSHVVEEDRPELRNQWDRMGERADRFEHEYRLRRKDGQVIWVLGQAMAERSKTGDVLAYVGSISDINRSKLDQIELRNYREHLEEMVGERTLELEVLNRELESFSYSVSHDLRAPLRAINGFVSVLMDEKAAALDDSARFFLHRIQANSRQMSELIEDLLELAKVSRTELKRQWVDLSAMALSIVEELKLSEPDRKSETSVASGLQAFGDPKLLHSLLYNLLSNAWKYSGRKEVARIDFGALDSGNSRAYYVRDNGVGFDASCAGELFRAFHRLHHSSEFEGTGIGLASVHRIVTRHGGRVWAEAKEGEGATFFFTLH